MIGCEGSFAIALILFERLDEVEVVELNAVIAVGLAKS